MDWDFLPYFLFDSWRKLDMWCARAGCTVQEIYLELDDQEYNLH